MYAHYANVKGVRKFAKYLTQLQIVQLFGGAYMNYLSYNLEQQERYRNYALINGLVCMSYGLMFLQFYYAKYNKKAAERAAKRASNTTEEATEKDDKNKKDKKSRYVIIDGEQYDITGFKHPGGSVINYMSQGQNATQAFNEFHNRSKKARKVLASLPHTKAPDSGVEDPDQDLLTDFATFRQSLIDRGFFKPSYSLLIYRILEQAVIFSFGVYMISRHVVIAVMAMGLFRARSGWLQHEGGHNSLTGNIRIDKFIQEFFIGFGLHCSGNMWNKMHNKHHATPQKSKYDIDLDTTPLVAFYDMAVESNRRKSFSKLWLKYQALTFLPITSGIFVPLFWAFYLHPRQVIIDRNVTQVFFMVLSHVVPVYLFMSLGDYTFWVSLFLSSLCTWLSDMYLFGHFSLSHTTTEVIGEDENPSWVRYAVEHSVDISIGNPVVDWIMGY